jgi:hypothetical protein
MWLHVTIQSERARYSGAFLQIPTTTPPVFDPHPVKMRSTRTSDSIATRRQTDVGRSAQSSTAKQKARGTKTARSANERASAPLQDLTGANKDTEMEIAGLKGVCIQLTHLRDLLTLGAAQLVEAQRLQKEAEGKVARLGQHAANEDDDMMIRKPKGEAGDKKNGFNLRMAMKLDDVGQKDLYDAIQVC